MAQLFDASFVDRVVDGGAASGFRPGDLVAQGSRVPRETLDDLRLVVEGHHKSFILIAAQHAKQKIDRSILLELDAVADAVGSVQQHANAQRQIGLLTEVTDFLEKLIVPNLEVSLIELGDQLVAAVLHSEKPIA